MSQYQAAAPNRPLGTVLALLTIPVGLVVYSLMYQAGFIASIVAFGIAWLASLLYRVGSGTALDRNGAIRVTIITIVALLISIFGAIVWSLVSEWSKITGMPALSALGDPSFQSVVSQALGDSEFTSSLAPDILIGLAFGALGCFSTLRRAWRTTAAQNPSAGYPGQYPGQPFAGQQYPGQQYPGQQMPGQPYVPQPYPGQPYPGQAYPGQPTADPTLALPASADAPEAPRGPYGRTAAEEQHGHGTTPEAGTPHPPHA